ncbi:MAG: biotin/lipoyl-binding protein [Planctomycetales bacterium]|nr:biotin/lipoyl-binding protein [Planctomycetales bacterium]
MTRKHLAFLKAAPLCILLASVAFAVTLRNMKKAPDEKANQTNAPLVETVSVVSCDEGFFIEVDGVVTPYREVTLSAQVAGRIKYKSESAQAGSVVEQGDLLVEIDPRDYELEIKQLQETVKQSGVSIEEADIEKSNTEELVTLTQGELDLQITEVRRYEDLAKRNAGSQLQADTAKRSEIRVRNQLQAYRNQITLVSAKRNRLLRQKEQALANLEKALLNLERTKISSPLSGIVMADQVEQDDFVQPGTPVVSLEDRSKVEVRFNLQLQELRWLWGDTASTLQNDFELPKVDVEVYLDLDDHRYKWTARLARYDGAGINPATRTVPCIAIVDRPSAGELVLNETSRSAVTDLPVLPTLMRGLFVSLRIPVKSNLDLVTIPSESLRPGNRIWLAKNNRLEQQQVEIAYADKNNVVLLANTDEVKPGDRVITSPLPLITEGMEIRDEGAQTLISADEFDDKEAL